MRLPDHPLPDPVPRLKRPLSTTPTVCPRECKAATGGRSTVLRGSSGKELSGATITTCTSRFPSSTSTVTSYPRGSPPDTSVLCCQLNTVTVLDGPEDTGIGRRIPVSYWTVGRLFTSGRL